MNLYNSMCMSCPTYKPDVVRGHWRRKPYSNEKIWIDAYCRDTRGRFKLIRELDMIVKRLEKLLK